MSPDALLGRDFCFRQNVDNTVTFALVTVVGLCPAQGVRLAGKGFASTWVDRRTWHRLLRAGVLFDA